MCCPTLKKLFHHVLSSLLPPSLQRTSTTESYASPTMRWPWSTSLSFPQRSGCLCTERSKPLEHHTLPLHPSSGVHILVNYCQSLSPGLSVCLSVCWFVCISVCLFVCVCLSVSLCLCLLLQVVLHFESEVQLPAHLLPRSMGHLQGQLSPSGGLP